MSNSMNIPPEAIQEYQELCRQHYNAEISNEQAAVGATKLLGLFAAIYKPINENDYEKNNPATKGCK